MEQNEIDVQKARELEEKEFNLHLETKVPPSIKREYSDLFFSEQMRLGKENGGKPVTISLEQKRYLLNKAISNITIGRVDSEKMKDAWERETSKGGRPPIGGAKDD
jgi:hypothetical protein